MGAFISTALVIEEQERLFHAAIHKRWSFVFLDVSPCDKRLTFCPCAISTTLKSAIPALSRLFKSSGRLSFFDTSEVNQRHCLAKALLCSIMLEINLTSPPGHQSSVFCPPKLRVDDFPLPRLRHLRCVPLLASSIEE